MKKTSAGLAGALGVVALAAVGCGRTTNLELGVNQQFAYIASVDGSAAIRNTGYTPVTVIKESAEREPILREDLQPRDRMDRGLLAGERITIMSPYNLPAEVRVGFSSRISEGLTTEGPSPAPPLR